MLCGWHGIATGRLAPHPPCAPLPLPCRSISNIQWWFNPFAGAGGNEYNLMPMPVRSP